MWIETLAGQTKARIVAHLRRDALTVPELADRLGISGNAVRGHVASLERDGLVEAAGTDRETGGKPARRYRITEAGEELFPKAYAVVLSGLLSVLEERGGAEEVRELLRELASRAVPPAADGASLPVRVAHATRVVEELGGDLDVEERTDGWLLSGRGCPLSAVVGEHPALCGLVQELIARAAGAPVEECCDRSERPGCRFLVRG